MAVENLFHESLFNIFPKHDSGERKPGTFGALSASAAVFSGILIYLKGKKSWPKASGLPGFSHVQIVDKNTT
jgi:hypothetical protein